MNIPPSGRDAGVILLMLSRVPGLGPARINAITSYLGCTPGLLDAASDDFLRVPGIGTRLAEEIAGFLGDRTKRRTAEQAAHEQMEQAEQVGARLVTIFDPLYPDLLRQIYDPPPCLFVRGTFSRPEPPSLAVVGTRKATLYGKKAASGFSEALALRGFEIVSGLAYGIDQAAHEAALRAGGRTIAVLASGIDNIYTDPRGKLWPKIIEQGAIVSEEWFGTEPLPGKFPKRNRIISGMTLGTLIVESDLQGGSLITASFALEQNREVFAVPGNIYSASSRGTNRLIQSGQAKAVTGTDDIIEELRLPHGNHIPNRPEKAFFPQAPLSDEEKRLLAEMEEEPLHLDRLAEKTGIDISVLLVLLFELELKKAVIQLPGQFFQKNR
ncbi:MAG: DNA-protecting protein DprA [Chlorobi bacterium]|nr:DNA-protecting protein DprA [Chlorobiota bacterium]